MEKLSQKIANNLVGIGFNPENLDVYVYGIECTINEIVSDIIVFFIAFILNIPLEMLVWQLFWLPLRVNLGGFHAKTHFLCIFTSTFLALICVLVVPYVVNFPWLFFTEIAVTFFAVFVIKPVIHPNKMLSDKRLNKFKKTVKIIFLVECVIAVIFYFTLPLWVAHTASLGMFAAAILCIIAKFTNPKLVSHN